MPEAIRSKAADADLVRIWGYIAEDNAEAADATLDYIDAEFRKLARHPGIGRERPEIVEGFLCFTVFKPSWRSRFLVFYRPIADGIEVARVLEGHLDVARIFEG